MPLPPSVVRIVAAIIGCAGIVYAISLIVDGQAVAGIVVIAVVALLLWGSERAQAAQADLHEATRTCPDCATIVPAEANVCAHCGYRWAPSPD